MAEQQFHFLPTFGTVTGVPNPVPLLSGPEPSPTLLSNVGGIKLPENPTDPMDTTEGGALVVGSRAPPPEVGPPPLPLVGYGAPLPEAGPPSPAPPAPEAGRLLPADPAGVDSTGSRRDVRRGNLVLEVGEPFSGGSEENGENPLTTHSGRQTPFFTPFSTSVPKHVQFVELKVENISEWTDAEWTQFIEEKCYTATCGLADQFQEAFENLKVELGQRCRNEFSLMHNDISGKCQSAFDELKNDCTKMVTELYGNYGQILQTLQTSVGTMENNINSKAEADFKALSKRIQKLNESFSLEMNTVRQNQNVLHQKVVNVENEISSLRTIVSNSQASSSNSIPQEDLRAHLEEKFSFHEMALEELRSRFDALLEDQNEKFQSLSNYVENGSNMPLQEMRCSKSHYHPYDNPFKRETLEIKQELQVDSVQPSLRLPDGFHYETAVLHLSTPTFQAQQPSQTVGESTLPFTKNEWLADMYEQPTVAPYPPPTAQVPAVIQQYHQLAMLPQYQQPAVPQQFQQPAVTQYQLPQYLQPAGLVQQPQQPAGQPAAQPLPAVQPPVSRSAEVPLEEHPFSAHSTPIQYLPWQFPVWYFPPKCKCTPHLWWEGNYHPSSAANLNPCVYPPDACSSKHRGT